MKTRRFFLGSLGLFAAVAAVGGAFWGVNRATAQRDEFLIEPGGETFAYVDGWVVKVDRVR